MTHFSDIQQLLENAVNGDTIGKHGNFWRGKSRDEFVQLKVYGKPIIVVGDGSNSLLIKALEGSAPFDGSTYQRMPFGYPPLGAASIEIIKTWINNGCPQ